MDGFGSRKRLRASLSILLSLFVLGLGWVSIGHSPGPGHDDTCTLCQVAHGGWTVVAPPAPFLPSPSALDSVHPEAQRTPHPSAGRLPCDRGPPPNVDVPDPRA